jgi:DNA invertase Pin-like site-specific DNA recombinase
MSEYPTTRAAIYFRMSTHDQEDSIERQRSQVIPYAHRHGYAIVGEYTDEGIPGDEVERRKDFRRLLADAEADAFDVILCDDRDRFGRFDSIDYGYYVKPLRDRGLWLETVAQGKLDWHSFVGRVSDTVQQEAKQIEAQAISRRVLSGLVNLAKKGHFLGSPIPYGYRLHVETDARGQRVPGTSKLALGDAREVQAVRLMFKLYGVEGYSIEGVCEELYRRGIPSPRGCARWSKQTVAHILANRRYTGDMLWNEGSKSKYTELAKGSLQQYGRRAKQFRRHEAEDFILVPDAHEAIIDRETFERVQGRLTANRFHANPARPAQARPRRQKPSSHTPKKRHHYRLSGLLVCGNCGARMAAVTTPKGQVRYQCSTNRNYGAGVCSSNSIKESFLMDRLITHIEKDVLNPDGLAELHERRRREAERLKKEQPAKLETLRKQAAELTRKIDGLTGKLAVLAEVDPEGVRHYAQDIRLWRAQRQAVETKIAEVLRPPALVDLDEAAGFVRDYLGRLRDLMKSGEPRRMRLLLGELVDRIEVYFVARKCPKYVRSRFDRGVIYVRQQRMSVSSKTQGRL